MGKALHLLGEEVEEDVALEEKVATAVDPTLVVGEVKVRVYLAHLGIKRIVRTKVKGQRKVS